MFIKFIMFKCSTSESSKVGSYLLIIMQIFIKFDLLTIIYLIYSRFFFCQFYSSKQVRYILVTTSFVYIQFTVDTVSYVNCILFKIKRYILLNVIRSSAVSCQNVNTYVRRVSTYYPRLSPSFFYL